MGVVVMSEPDSLAARFAEFYQVEFDAVFLGAVATCGVGDVALEATQEAFCRAFARWGRLHSEPWAGAWVMTTTLNLCRRRLRKRPSAGQTLADNSRGELSSIEDRVDLLTTLRKLPPRQREAILLHYFGDYPVGVVAEMMGLSEGTVKTHLHRGRRTVQTLLEYSR